MDLYELNRYTNLGLYHSKAAKLFNYTLSAHQTEMCITLGSREPTDLIAVLPTGSGKTLPLLLHAMISPSTWPCIVVAPLKSLIKNQIEDNILNNIPSIAITGETKNRATIINQASKYAFIYITPETCSNLINNYYFRTLLQKLRLLVIDEAHCISTWGHDFRKSYLDLWKIRANMHVHARVVCLTATADDVVVHDIIRQVHIKGDPRIIYAPGLPEKLSICSVKKRKGESLDQLVRILSSSTHKTSDGFIFCNLVEECNAVFKHLTKLNSHSRHVFLYHGQMDDEHRQEVHDAWRASCKKGKKTLMVCTIAFAMGVDSRASFIVVYSIPSCIVWLLQILGRTGRLGSPSRCYATIMTSDKDLETAKAMHGKSLNEVGCDNGETYLCRPPFTIMERLVRSNDPRQFLLSYLHAFRAYTPTPRAPVKVYPTNKEVPHPQPKPLPTSSVPKYFTDDEKRLVTLSGSLTRNALAQFWAREGAKARKCLGGRAIYHRSVTQILNKRKSMTKKGQHIR